MKASRISRNLYLVSYAGRRFALLAENSADAIVKFVGRHLLLDTCHRRQLTS